MKCINTITNYLMSRNIIETTDRDIYNYGLFVLLYNSFLLLDILIMGFLFKQLYFTVLFLIFWCPYRIFVGGIHCSTPVRCYLGFNITYLLALLLMNFNIDQYYYFIAIIVLFFLQFLKTDNKKTLLLFILLYLILYSFVNPTTLRPFNIAYLLNSTFNIYQLYSSKKYLF